MLSLHIVVGVTISRDPLLQKSGIQCTFSSSLLISSRFCNSTGSKYSLSNWLSHSLSYKVQSNIYVLVVHFAFVLFKTNNYVLNHFVRPLLLCWFHVFRFFSWDFFTNCSWSLFRRHPISHPEPSKILRRMLDENEGSGNDQFLGDPDWFSEMQYNTISPLFADY